MLDILDILFGYHIIKKHFAFLVEDFGFEIEYSQWRGVYLINYKNSKIRFAILGENNISILVSDANSLGTYYDVTEYADEFRVSGSYSKKAAAAAEWLRNKLEQGYEFPIK